MPCALPLHASKVSETKRIWWCPMNSASSGNHQQEMATMSTRTMTKLATTCTITRTTTKAFPTPWQVSSTESSENFCEDKPEIGRAHAELQSLMRISYAVFCLKKKNNKKQHTINITHK